MSFSRSLSFLDLITCGFGAILLLFLVMLVTVDDLRIRENNNPQPSPSPQQNDVPSTAVAPENKNLPFLAWVEFSEASSGKNQSPSINLFKFTGEAKGVKIGKDFLVVYRKKPPKEIKPITVEVPPNQSLRVKIVAVIDGEMRVHRRFLTTTGKREFKLWPGGEVPQ